MNKRLLPTLATLFALIPLAAAIAAGDASKQISTATAHAKMAAATKDIGMIHAHLHHVINCLVGPKGKRFDAKAEDPCKGMGNGAISDFAGPPAARAKLQMAVRTAESGIHDARYKGAHDAALEVVKLIEKASAPR
ncbi:MAG TPA: hypothetical protein VFM15_02600 [Gammaproteobacteria bacterium]|nr:hypothetical protein [Gammaproteobacteria bacterium]